MPIVQVTGFTTADIHTARDAAGPGGTVIFQDGLYDSDGLTASVVDQTWILQRYTIIKRTAANTTQVALNITAHGFRIRGGTVDSNRAANTGSFIVVATNADLDAEDTIFQGAGAWGLAITDGLLAMNRCIVKDTKYACVIFRCSTLPSIVGPQIDRCVFDRSNENGATIQSGGVLIGDTRGPTVETVRYVSFTNNRIEMPFSHAGDCVALEIIQSQRATICGNVINAGRIGVSCGGGFFHVDGNTFALQSSYAIEDGGHDSVICNNSGTGYYTPAPPEQAGITVNPVAKNETIFCNRFPGFTVPISINSGATLIAQWANN